MTASPALRFAAAWLVPATACLLASRLPAADAKKKLNEKVRAIAGSAEFLRSVPKHFATLKGLDRARRQVTLLSDGETLSKVWPLTVDAEIKVAGWWGRLEQLTVGDRVWAWFKTNRAGKPTAVFMLADEVSQQDIHGAGVTLEAVGKSTITIKPVKGKSRVLKTDRARVIEGTAPSEKGEGQAKSRGVAGLKAGSKVYVQSAGDQALVILKPQALEHFRAQQKAALRKHWREKGLPGTVTFLHLSGEMDYMLDHEAMRWGRSLKPGDKVSLLAEPPMPAVVKEVNPWRERTQLRLVLKGADLADLTIGQRLGLKMTPPTPVERAQLPPDAGRRTGKKERVEWFLASIYCTCGVSGNVCTGQFYTLASCNPNGCGMPNHMRKKIAAQIDKGRTDQQIFEALLKEYGPDLLRPHLLP